MHITSLGFSVVPLALAFHCARCRFKFVHQVRPVTPSKSGNGSMSRGDDAQSEHGGSKKSGAVVESAASGDIDVQAILDGQQRLGTRLNGVSCSVLLSIFEAVRECCLEIAWGPPKAMNGFCHRQ
jgi:hypothetical protein